MYLFLLREITRRILQYCCCCGGFSFAIALAAQSNSHGSSSGTQHELPPPLPQKASTHRTSARASTVSNESVKPEWQFFAGASNNPVPRIEVTAAPKTVEDFEPQLELARQYRLNRQFVEATATYSVILRGAAPESLQRTVLIELAQTADDQNDPIRVQQIYAQCLARWPHDAGVPELILRQGLLYRQMGLNDLAIAKFYSVMTSALTLKPERFDYYQQLVLRAQNEIADVQYERGNWAVAADSLGRLLKLEVTLDNRASIQCKLLRCLVALGRHGDALVQAQDFLNRYREAPERPEVRFLCATALRHLGRDAEALRQVLALLQDQYAGGTRDTVALAYWQRRAGNEIANQFYQEGEPMKALDIYLSLAKIDSSPEWQLPVWYQLGLVFERLNQSTKAVQYYRDVMGREKELGTEVSPSLKVVVEMARWRKDFLEWKFKSENTNLEFRAILGNEPSARSIQPKDPQQ